MLFVTMASEAERQALRELQPCAVGRVALRALMVLWSAEGVAVPQIAQRLACQPKTVRKWLCRYRARQVAGLFDLPRSGRPSSAAAVARQALWMQVHQPPSTYGYVQAFWTLATLCQHLAVRCRVYLSRWKTRLLLREMRFRHARPKVAPRRVDPEREVVNAAIARRIHEVREEKAVLVEDETEIRLFPLLRKMWMRIGEQVRLVCPLRNEKRTIFGAIDIATGEVFHRTYRRKRTVEMIAFLADMLGHYQGGGILLVLDHASIHKSRALKEWLAAHPAVELIYLPRYGGHRDNPVEKLWWHLKGYAAANRCCRSMEELIGIVERYLKQLTPEKVFQLVG